MLYIVLYWVIVRVCVANGKDQFKNRFIVYCIYTYARMLSCLYLWEMNWFVGKLRHDIPSTINLIDACACFTNVQGCIAECQSIFNPLLISGTPGSGKHTLWLHD